MAPPQPSANKRGRTSRNFNSDELALLAWYGILRGWTEFLLQMAIMSYERGCSPRHDRV